MTLRIWLLFLLFLLVAMTSIDAQEPAWLTLPPTPQLPKPERSAFAKANNIELWYATFGHTNPHHGPVILLHGGMANANYWGLQIPALAQDHEVIVVDSRGQGRSTWDGKAVSYHLMAFDVIALMDHLKITKADIVGWSDGAIIGLDLAIHHPERLSGLFAFAANSDPSGTQDGSQSAAFQAYLARTEAEYTKLAPTPTQWKNFMVQMNRMWRAEPQFTAAQLSTIRTPTWIVDGDHDEIIRRDNTAFMASHIPKAKLVFLKDGSHFAFLQTPEAFNAELRRFLDEVTLP